MDSISKYSKYVLAILNVFCFGKFSKEDDSIMVAPKLGTVKCALTPTLTTRFEVFSKFYT